MPTFEVDVGFAWPELQEAKVEEGWFPKRKQGNDHSAD